MSKNVFFTGGRSPYTLSLLRLFHNKGYKIYVGETYSSNIAGVSKYVEKNLLLPPPSQEPDNFNETLKKYVLDYKIDLLIPTCEEVFYISKYMDELNKYCKVFTVDISKLKTLHSKYLFIQLLIKIGVNYPQTKIFTNIDLLKEEVKNQDFFVIKPEFSRFASLTIINNKSKVEEMKISEDYPWVIQEFIDGEAFCSYSVAYEGKVTAHSIYPSFYRAGQGATIYFESAVVPEIDEIVGKIVKELNYTGQISFDFIKCKKTGKCYPIECNPRSTSGIYLFGNNDNLPSAFEGKNEKPIVPDSKVTGMSALAMLIYELPNKIRSWKNLKKFVSDFKNSKDTIWDSGDIKPFLAQFSTMKHYGLISRKKKISFLEALTSDIEWNGN